MNDIRTGTISITGLAALEKQLQQLPDKLAKNVLRGAVRAGAVAIQKEAKALAPQSVAFHRLGAGSRAVEIQPGSLKKGIKVRSAPRKLSEFAITYWVYVSKKLWYWKFVEFGTVKMAAKPFMRPAFESQKETATIAVRNYMEKRIDKELDKMTAIQNGD